VVLLTVHQILLVVASLLIAEPDSQGQQRHDTDAAWSPDGKKLVFMSDRDGDIEIYTTELTGGRDQRLTSSPGRDAHPAYSRDGKMIAFQSPRDGGEPQIYVMQADGSEQKRLSNLRGFAGVPDWSPDGKQILFQVNENPTLEPTHWQRYLINADGSGAKPLTHDRFNDQVPKWSPDGLKIAFFSDKTGNNQIYTMRTDGFSVAPPDQQSVGRHFGNLVARWPGDSVYLGPWEWTRRLCHEC